MSVKKIAVVGTVIDDLIILPNQQKAKSLGGIAYTVYTLGKLLGEKASIIPIANVGKNIFNQVSKEFSRLPGVDIRGLTKVKTENNFVTLHYDKRLERREVLKNRVPPLSFSQLENFLKADFFLVNFISGFDISLQNFLKLSENFKGKLFVDIHSLPLGIKRDGTRFTKYPENWEKIVSNCDIVQMNLREMEILLRQKIKFSAMTAYFKKILQLGPQIFLLTLGRKGSYVSYKEKSKISYRYLSGRRVKVVDPTGCGDVFGAAFLAKYSLNRDPVEAAKFANQMAAWKATFSGVEKIYSS